MRIRITENTVKVDHHGVDAVYKTDRPHKLANRLAEVFKETSDELVIMDLPAEYAISVDGTTADKIGKIGIQKIAKAASEALGTKVAVQVIGTSRHHEGYVHNA